MDFDRNKKPDSGLIKVRSHKSPLLMRRNADTLLKVD